MAKGKRKRSASLCEKEKEAGTSGKKLMKEIGREGLERAGVDLMGMGALLRSEEDYAWTETVKETVKDNSKRDKVADDLVLGTAADTASGQPRLLSHWMLHQFDKEILNVAKFAVQHAVLDMSKRISKKTRDRESVGWKRMTPEALYHEVFRVVAAHRKGLEKNTTHQTVNLATLKKHLKAVFGVQLDSIDYKIVYEYLVTAQDQIPHLTEVHGVPRPGRRPIGGVISHYDYSMAFKEHADTPVKKELKELNAFNLASKQELRFQRSQRKSAGVSEEQESPTSPN